MNKGVSVIICCYNSASRLAETVSHLACQRVASDLSWEVILIDNGSTDNTISVFQELVKDTPIDNISRVINENRQGLMYAREKGIENSKYSYILFCDDDNWLCPSYIQTVFIFFENHPRAGVIGGKGVPVFETDEMPFWFKKMERSYACGTAQAGTGQVDVLTDFVVGAGMSVRKECLDILQKADYVSVLKGRQGDKLTSGDDLELMHVISMTGYEIWSSEEMLYHHYIPKERLSESYLLKLVDGCSRANVSLDAYKFVLRQYKVDKAFLWQRIYIRMSTNMFFRNTSIKDIFSQAERVSHKSYLDELARNGCAFKSKIRSIYALQNRLNNIRV
jgi:glycosyltransferase involved in cell wall biosynthesis